jgi:hypothetical protein
MRDDPWTAANRDKEQQNTTPRRRKPTAETASPQSKPTVSSGAIAGLAGAYTNAVVRGGGGLGMRWLSLQIGFNLPKSNS